MFMSRSSSASQRTLSPSPPTTCLCYHGCSQQRPPPCRWKGLTNYSFSDPCTTKNWDDLCVALEEASRKLWVPRHLVLPPIAPDDTYMSLTYTRYLQGARQMLATGVPRDNLLGRGVCVDVFFRQRCVTDNFDCASWACEVCRSYETDVFVRLASVSLLTFMMRWLLDPSAENYQKIPDMMKPTPAQCMIPHIAAIETMPLAPVRDAAIHQPRDWRTALVQAKCSINWPYGHDAAVERDPGTGSVTLTKRFMDHAAVYDNWSVGSSFLDVFPEVAGHIRVHDI